MLQLDQRETHEAMRLQLVQDSRELGDGRPKRCLARLQVSCRLRRPEVMHEHQAGGKVRILATRPGDDIADNLNQDLAS